MTMKEDVGVVAAAVEKRVDPASCYQKVAGW